MDRAEKEDLVASLHRTFSETAVVLVTHYSGLTVAEIGDLRKRMRGYEDYIHVNGYADPGTVVAYMQACDRLIIPSRVESIPLVFVDALQMKLPVIAADTGDLGELVRQFGVGTIVPSGDPHALSAEMQRVHPRSRGELIGAWEKAQETFDLQRSAMRCADALALAQQIS